jgi:hypothetical protein
VGGRGSSVIDLIFYGSNTKCSNFCIEEPGFKSHKILTASFKLSELASTAKSKTEKFNLDVEHMDFLIQSQYRKLLQTNNESKDVCNFYENLVKFLQESHRPKPIFNQVSEPWYNSDCYRLKQRVSEIRYELDTLESLNSNLGDFNLLKREILEKYREAKKDYLKMCKTRKSEYELKREQKILQEAGNNKCYKILQLGKIVQNTNNKSNLKVLARALANLVGACTERSSAHQSRPPHRPTTM